MAVSRKEAEEMGDTATKRMVGAPITVWGRTLIPVVELSVYSRRIQLGDEAGGLVFTGVTVSPVSVKVMEGDEEWVMSIQESRVKDD